MSHNAYSMLWPGIKAMAPSFDLLYARVDPAVRSSLQQFRQSYQSRQVVVNGLRWKYIAAAEARAAILFLHGLAGSPDIWWQQMATLQDRYHCLAASYAPADSLAEMAGGLLAVLDAEQIERVNLVGTSLGGYVAQYLLAAHPDRIERTILANTFPPNEIIAQTYWLPAALLPYMPEWLVMAVMRASYRRRIYPSSGHSELVLAFLTETTYGQMGKADISSRYRVVTEPFEPVATAARQIPVLIIETDNDPLVPPDLRLRLRQTYPQAAVHNLSGAGHFPYLNQPDNYNRIVDGFLRRPIRQT
jgi:maspardin